jgi:23S rRNA pseudouridine1911/1915/1917 synthase
MSSEPLEHTVTVPPEAAGQRLDKFLADALGVPRRRVMAAFEKGDVRVGRRRAKKGEPAEPGRGITVRLPPPPAPPEPQPELPLSVVFSDDAVVVVEKPAGWPTHPLAPGEKGTLANALVARFPDCAEAGADLREAGFVHRLDTETSGLIVAARNREAWEALRSQLTARTVEKDYLALAAGSVFGPIEVNVPIGKEPGTPGKMAAAADDRAAVRLDAREARTLVEVERRFPGWTLVRCRIETGVTHQIRVHLSHLGSPVAGDDLYGGARPAGLHRMFLHATRLSFDHPVTGKRVTFASPLPPELQRVVDALAA